MTSEIKDMLFSVIRCGMEREKEDLQLSEEMCRELMRLGSRQSILPIVYNGLKQQSVPDEWLQKYDKVRLRGTYSVIQRDESLRSVCSALNKENIQYILLKGAVLRNLYPHPYLRTSSDIDVLVHEEEIDRAVDAIETNTDFQKQKVSFHDVSMLSPWFHLELHFNIMENEEKIDRTLSKAWEFAVPTGEGSAYAFTPEYQIFHVVAHMCHHFSHGGLGIRPFIDLWLLKKKNEYDEDTVRDLCSSCGILKFYETSCRLSRVWMEKCDHTELTAMLEEICLTGGVFGSYEFKNAARQRKHRGIMYVLSRVFPPAYQIKRLYNDPTGKDHILPYYYLKRFVSYVGRDRRKDLKNQIEKLIGSDQKYLDLVQELFRRLGL